LFSLGFQEFLKISRNNLAKWKWKWTWTSNELEDGDDHHQEEDLKVIWNFEQEQPNSTIFKDRAHFSCEVYH